MFSFTFFDEKFFQNKVKTNNSWEIFLNLLLSHVSEVLNSRYPIYNMCISHKKAFLVKIKNIKLILGILKKKIYIYIHTYVKVYL